MPIEIREIIIRADLKRFIFLPAQVNRHRPLWLPPIYMDEWRYFDQKKNRAFGYSDTTLAVAFQDGKPAGRIMGIINRRCNELNKEHVGRFGFLESVEDPAVVHALLNYVEEWARAKGMNKIVGPMGFTDQDPEGFLIEGFEHEPTMQTYFNPEWLVRMVEAEGYTKEIDYVVYLVAVPDEVPRLYERVSARLIGQKEFQLVEFKDKKILKSYVRKVFGLWNATYSALYGYVPMEDQEMDELAEQYLPIIDPRFIKVVMKGEDLVGFVIGIPNINPGLRRSRGHLFPFGILHILASMRKSKQLDLFLGGIRQDCRGRGLDVLMGTAMMRSAMAAGFERIDSHLEMETNVSVRGEMEHVGGKVYKRHRIFQKALS